MSPSRAENGDNPSESASKLASQDGSTGQSDSPAIKPDDVLDLLKEARTEDSITELRANGKSFNHFAAVDHDEPPTPDGSLPATPTRPSPPASVSTADDAPSIQVGGQKSIVTVSDSSGLNPVVARK